jgi:hypothetical protein
MNNNRRVSFEETPYYYSVPPHENNSPYFCFQSPFHIVFFIFIISYLSFLFLFGITCISNTGKSNIIQNCGKDLSEEMIYMISIQLLFIVTFVSMKNSRVNTRISGIFWFVAFGLITSTITSEYVNRSDSCEIYLQHGSSNNNLRLVILNQIVIGWLIFLFSILLIIYSFKLRR